MSRVGKYAVVIPQGVSIVLDKESINVKGSKGALTLSLTKYVHVTQENNEISIKPASDTTESRCMWGTTRALINNMVRGVSEGYKIVLEVNGVGYRAAVQGKNLVLQLGYSHEIVYPIDANVSMTCPDQTHIAIEGVDKQLVGQIAANIRAYRKPEPYKGKGIKYADEVIIRKEGKKK